MAINSFRSNANVLIASFSFHKPLGMGDGTLVLRPSGSASSNRVTPPRSSRLQTYLAPGYIIRKSLHKQLKMLLGWAALHQDEPMENWALAERKQELFEIAPLQ